MSITKRAVGLATLAAAAALGALSARAERCSFEDSFGRECASYSVREFAQKGRAAAQAAVQAGAARKAAAPASDDRLDGIKQLLIRSYTTRTMTGFIRYRPYVHTIMAEIDPSGRYRISMEAVIERRTSRSIDKSRRGVCSTIREQWEETRVLATRTGLVSEPDVFTHSERELAKTTRSIDHRGTSDGMLCSGGGMF